jgi:iron complex outermembrane recepter protein
MKRSLLGPSAFAFVMCCAAAENPAEVLEVQQIEIVGTTPLPGSGVQLRKLPANAQVFTGRDLRLQRSSSVTDFLDLNAGSVNISAAQGNPYQPDVNFRGFTASPLLGTPQGLSVFLDGVRLNEPFGDALNWDLIPSSAIGSIQIIPGSNPAFGLNSLGGAIALYTKSGASEYPSAPGGSVTLSGGSFGRRSLGLEGGGKHGAWDWFMTGQLANDAGWAEHNASQVRQVFAKLGWQDETTDLDVTVVGANNRLSGTQTLPLSFTNVPSANIRQAYTYPDENRNRAALLAIKGSQAVNSSLLVSGTVYLRHYDNHNISSNVNANFGDDDPVQATNEKSAVTQTQAGLGLQLVHSGKVFDFSHKLSVGASVDQGRSRYELQSQAAAFTADRGTTALAAFGSVTDANTSTRYLGAFFSDALELSPQWTLSLAARANRADVQISDRSGTQPELNDSHHFNALRPALGISFNPSQALTAYANFSQGMRAPTAMELTCADPDKPCRLPNSFLSDPPLKPVLSTTFEAGARGKLDANNNWQFAVFRTDLKDDLQFISSSSTTLNAGYFQNVAATRRQGIEMGGSTRWGKTQPLTLTAQYNFLNATYQSAFNARSQNNSTADNNGAIAVQAGNQLPNIPRHSFKLRADWAFIPQAPAWRVVGQLQTNSGAYARGDENNQDSNGRLPGYSIFNLQLHGEFAPGWSFFARVDNVFNRRYSNFGVLGQNVFTGPGNSFDIANSRAEQFRGYGVPRGVWVGVQVGFGGGAGKAE